MTDKQTEALKLALDKKAENARDLGLDYEPENTLHWHALNYRTAPTQNAQKMFEALEKFVENAVEKALAQPEQEPCKTCGGAGEVETGIGMMICDECHGTTYTTPPQRTWVGLTDEDLAVCGDEDDVMLARYWERVCKEKNT